MERNFTSKTITTRTVTQTRTTNVNGLVQSSSTTNVDRFVSGSKGGKASIADSNDSNLSRAIEGTDEKNRPKSEIKQRGRDKNTRNSRVTKKTTTHYQDIDTFKEPVGFDHSAKGMKFGAPKLNSTVSTKRHSVATKTTRSRKTIVEDGMMTSLNKFEFQEEEAGPEIQ